ncbi:MAG: anthranilate phosphoribosyltransferase [Pseudohongiellaceae bacterium]|nr:anthranilate phosphoribosyltransferase [Pseudohongiellaceae bacterium]
MDIKAAIQHLVNGQNLTADQMISLMRDTLSGQASDAQIGAFLVALQIKGIVESELLGAVTVMRELSTKVEISDKTHLVDTCGTGGSGTNTFNISTAAAMVVACAGGKVAKHGNRGATSKSGSADLLEAAGVNLAVTPEAVAACVNDLGVGFMFAQSHHSAMKHVIGARKEIGVRTIFNLLGPLTNPASAPNQLLGVFDPQWIEPMLQVLKELGSEHVLIVSSDDGLDEISLSATTRVGELKDGIIKHFVIAPEDFGLQRLSGYEALQVNGANQSLEMVRGALSYENKAAGDIVALNAGAAIYAANLAPDIAAGIAKAQEILHSGKALQKLQELADYTAAQA